MNFKEAVANYGDGGEPFDLVIVASNSVRPEVVRSWFAFDDYRPSYAAAWAAMMGDESCAFEEDSPLDALAYGAFVEGWTVALRRVGSMLGINPDVFVSAIEAAGEDGIDLLPEGDIIRLQSVYPLKSDAGDVDRYFREIEAAMLGGRALCAHGAEQTTHTATSDAT